MDENKCASKQQAEEVLRWANEQNPGPWSEHSRVVARAAETIAKQCGLEGDKAYALGLLHDIGRYEGVRGLHHIYAGYELMAARGFDVNARICLTHSFPYQDLGAYSGGDIDCTDDEIATVQSVLTSVCYDDYDKLIQLCDAVGSANGVCLLEVRLLDVARRHGLNDFTLRKWASVFALKAYFDTLCKVNLYDLFYEEIRKVSFR